MIELGFHTDNWRPLSMSFEAAVEKGLELGLKHVEFAAIHGQNFIQAMGYDPVTTDDLVQRTGFPAAEVSSILLLLELQGHVSSSAGGLFTRLGNDP